MQKYLEQFKKDYPNLCIDDDNYKSHEYDDHGETISEKDAVRYFVSGIPEDNELVLILYDKEDFEELKKYLNLDLIIFSDFFAIFLDGKIEVLLTNLTGGIHHYRWRKHGKKIVINQNYLENKLDIEIEHSSREKPLDTALNFINNKTSSLRPLRAYTLLRIEGLNKPSNDGVSADIRNILNSVLFDFEISYGLAFETVNINNLKIRRVSGNRQKTLPLPDEPISLIHKEYIPELIEYYHIGAKVDYLPFKYICYFHVVEYFMDKSAYNVVKKAIKQLMLKPDFHVHTNDYIGQAINIFKKENDRYTTDKIKISRVFNEFVDIDEIKNFIDSIEQLNHFSSEIIIKGNKELKLPAINFEQEKAFYDSLTKRIYSLRCSIVHSNPDFDESKAIPFQPSPENMSILRMELLLIMEVARNIIFKSIK